MKVLVIMNAKNVRLGEGGIIQVILNFKDGFKEYNNYKFDYAVNSIKKSGVQELLEDENSHYYQLPNKSENIFLYIKTLMNICKKGRYDAVHIHGSSSTMVIELFCAWITGIKKRVAHCHNSQCTHFIINKFANPFMRFLTTDGVACSDLAGKWIFKENGFTIIRNAFNSEFFKFDENIRFLEREKLGITDELVLGMVGNLNKQKNPLYALNILKSIQNRHKAKLIYIGDGPLRNEIKQKAKEYRIEKNVKLLGLCRDVARKLQVIDVFLFPSLYEGLGISILEAQASGCLCLASDNVPRETYFLESTRYFTLNRADLWIDYIEKCCFKKHKSERLSQSKRSIARLQQKYDLKRETMKMKIIYEK